MKKIFKKCFVVAASTTILAANLTPISATTEVTSTVNTTKSYERAEKEETNNRNTESEVLSIESTEATSTLDNEQPLKLNIYKEISFDYTGEFQREDGTIINSGEDVGLYEDTRVEFNWSIPDGQEIKEGDTMTFDFPEQLQATGKAEFPIVNENGDVIGNAKIDPITGKVTVVFTDYYEKNPQDGRNGTVGFTTKWREEIINVEEDVPLVIDKEGEIVVSVIPPGENDPNEILEKWGETIENGMKTSWIVRLNYAAVQIKNAVYTDTLGSMQEIIPDEIFGYYGYYDSNNIFVRTTEIPRENFILNKSSFQIALGDLEKPNASVEIYYNTKNLDNGNSPQYENSGKLTGSNSIDKEITVQTPETGNSGSGTGKNIGIIKIKKIDSVDKNKTLAGAEFDIFNKDKTLVDHIITNEDGIAESSHLLVGEYTLVETKAPDGYELNPNPIPVKITFNGDVSIAEIIIENDPSSSILGSIKVIKQDEDNNKIHLAGAEFDVLNSEKEIIGSIKTDEKGEGELKNLPLGEYQLVETKAPIGYELDEKPIIVIINENNDNNTVTIVVKNKVLLPKGIIEIIKTDDVTGEKLSGAEFDIFNKNNQSVGHIVTNENGKGKLTNLEYGEYTIVETKAPSGYILSKQVYNVLIKKGTKDPVIIIIDNKKIIPTKPTEPQKSIKKHNKLPQTSENKDNIILLPLGLTFIVLAGILKKYR